MRIKVHVGYAVGAAGYLVGIFLLSSTPGDAPLVAATPSLVFNLLHVPLFAGLATSLVLAFTGGCWTRRLPLRLYVAIALLAIGYAGFDEWRQSWVPGRYGSMTDFCLNTLGALGLVLVHWLGRRRRWDHDGVPESPVRFAESPSVLGGDPDGLREGLPGAGFGRSSPESGTHHVKRLTQVGGGQPDGGLAGRRVRAAVPAPEPSPRPDHACPRPGPPPASQPLTARDTRA